MSSLAEATMDYMVQDPANAKKHWQGRVRCSLAGNMLIFFKPTND